MQELFDRVREACLPGLWSKGVKLVREERVVVENESTQELVLRVRVPTAPVPPTVSLYPEDQEWSCDCGSRMDPCEHVAAGVIAVHQATQKEKPLNRVDTVAARLSYRFGRALTGLKLERWVVHPDGSEAPLAVSLGGPAAAALGLDPSHDDLAIDRILRAMLRGTALEPTLPKLFPLLASCPDIRWGNQGVRVLPEPVLPVVRVADHGDRSVILTVQVPPAIEEVIGPGTALVGGALGLLGATELTGRRLEKLPQERVFGPEAFGELVTRILPELEERLGVTYHTRRLPREGAALPPRISFDLEQDGDRLGVFPTLVYGDPPLARIDRGQLIHLGGPLPKRNESEERRLLDRLRDELNLVPGRRVLVSGSEAMRFAARIRQWAKAHQDDHSARYFGEAPLRPHLVVSGERFELAFATDPLALTSDGGSSPDLGTPGGVARRASAEAVIGAWREGLDLVPLEGGGWAPLPGDWLGKFGHHVADLLAARNEEGEVATAALPALAELCRELGEPPPPRFEKLYPLLADFSGLPSVPVPDDVTATLRGYQREGYHWLCFLKQAGLGAVLADDMGLGKTLQALSVFARGAARTLVVCPRSVVHNWHAELQRFRPTLHINVYHGPKRELGPCEVTLTTYAVLRLDQELLARETWDTVVLDEAQAIKNPDSQAARAAYRLSAAFRLSLSGTPVENRLDELWSQLHFTNPGVLGSRRDFQARYADPIAAGDGAAAERLRRRVRPFVLRRLKKEVAPELPPRTDLLLYVELDDRERDLYRAVQAATRKDVIKALQGGGSVLGALEALLRLRQAACHPALLPGQEAEGSSKLERLVLALTDLTADGHKALVFSQWTSLLDLVEPHLRKAEIPFTRLDGSTRDRAGVVAAFQAQDGPPVLLISLKAGGTGLNLTAADHVFLLDPWWNPAVEDQAADRTHRIGQDKPVLVYRLVAKNTVEEGILALQAKKRALADVALAQGAEAAGITREDLLALLEYGDQ